jgi:hypothetical protein
VLRFVCIALHCACEVAGSGRIDRYILIRRLCVRVFGELHLRAYMQASIGMLLLHGTYAYSIHIICYNGNDDVRLHCFPMTVRRNGTLDGDAIIVPREEKSRKHLKKLVVVIRRRVMLVMNMKDGSVFKHYY